MSKVHLTYKVNGEATGAALCGNNARGYKHGLDARLPKDYRACPSSDRCAHCERLYLERRNSVRRNKGLPPVSDPFVDLDGVGA